MTIVDPWIGQVLADRYRIHGAIGRGGMGTVYAATQEALGRDVAIKMIRTDLGHNEEAVERFKREAQVIARLTHPNIVVIHDFGSTNTGELYIVMEKIVGASLKEIAKQVGGPIAWNDLFGVIVDTVSALKGAHAAGVIHRDLKPENIMVDTASGIAKVLDFGVAKLNDQNQGALTGTGMIMGTPGYMAPEVVMGRVLDDPRSDLYSLGLTWLELLIGRPCFKAPTPSAILIQQVNDGPPVLDDVLPHHGMPEPVKALLTSMLARNPDDRPRSADEVLQRLTALRAQIETGILPVVAAVAALPATEKASNPSLRALTVPEHTSVFANTPKDAPEAVTLPTSAFEALHPSHAAMAPVSSSNKLVPVVAAMALLLVIAGAAMAFVLFGRSDPATVATAETPVAAVKTPPPAPGPVAVDAAKATADAAANDANAAKDDAAKDDATGEATDEAKEDATDEANDNAKEVVASTRKAKSKAAAKSRSRKVAAKSKGEEDPPEETTKAPAGPPRLTSALIKRGIVSNLGKASKCRNTNIKRREEGPGILIDHCPSYKTLTTLQSIRLTVAPSGDVVNARFADAGANSSDIGACVVETVKQWKFPAFDDEGTGPKEISQRVAFEPCVPINGKCVF